MVINQNENRIYMHNVTKSFIIPHEIDMTNEKIDCSREVTWVGDKSSCLSPDIVSHGHV